MVECPCHWKQFGYVLPLILCQFCLCIYVRLDCGYDGRFCAASWWVGETAPFLCVVSMVAAWSIWFLWMNHGRIILPSNAVFRVLFAWNCCFWHFVKYWQSRRLSVKTRLNEPAEPTWRQKIASSHAQPKTKQKQTNLHALDLFLILIVIIIIFFFTPILLSSTVQQKTFVVQAKTKLKQRFQL